MDIKVNTASNVSTSKVKKNTNRTDDIMNLLGNNNKSASGTKEKDDFKDVLNSTSKDKSDVNDDSKVLNDNEKAAVNEVEDKEINVEEIEEKIDESSEEKIIDILNELVNMLSEMQKSDCTQSDLNADTINSDMLQKIIDKLNSSEKVSTDTSNSSIQNLLEKLTELLNSEKLDTTSISVLESLLQKLNSSLDEKSNLSNSIKNLISDLQTQNESKAADKTLSLEDLLNRSASKENYSGSNDEKNSDLLKQENTKSSKDEDVLNKLLKDNSTDNKISMFSFRASLAQASQNASQVNTVTDVNKVTMVKDLIQDVKFMQTNSIKELTVKVNPGNLGQITIKLSSEDGIMKATLRANSKETAELMIQNVAEIKKAMDSQNIKIADVNIELYQDDTTFFKQEKFEEQMNNQQGNNTSNGSNAAGSMEEAETVEENADEQSNVNFLA